MINLPFFFKNKRRPSDIKPVVLVIMDGFGIAPPSEGNATSKAKTPNYNNLLANYPHTELIASGEVVGLPANEVGNTEVGHLTLGAGRTIYQDLKKINIAIEKGSFFDNKAFLAAVAHVKKFSSKLHILGMVSSGNVHSCLEHLYALLQFCKKEEVPNVFLHIFTDGRDAPPNEGLEIVYKLEEKIQSIKKGQIASVCGRYFAMDRDRRWDRTQKAWTAIVLGQGVQAPSIQKAIKSAYAQNQSDEFIEPTVIVKDSHPIATVDDNDAVVFFNFRIDRPKQLTMAFIMEEFEKLKSFDFGYDPVTSKQEGKVVFSGTFDRVKRPKNLFFVTMTEYQKGLPVSAIAFGPEEVQNALPVVISEKGFKQMHMAESEKERFVTYYFDGLREQSSPGEESFIVDSPRVPTYDKKPEMSLPKLVSEFKKQLYKGIYHFIVINFANPDMVAHSGNFSATITAIEVVDKYLNEVVSEVLGCDGTVFVTADHGNAEELLTFPASTFFYTTSQGTVNTEHSNNPVPFIVINKELTGNPRVLPKGSLANVAPTILAFMGVEIPPVMTGQNLLK